MGNCKIVYNDEVLIDLSQDSVTPETLDEGVTAHDKDGNPIVGTRKPATEPVLQEKRVTPKETPQYVEPDDGYDGLAEVYVGAIPSAFIRPEGTLSITKNGTTADVSEYEKVNVSIPMGSRTITENGRYIASDSGWDGFAAVTVSVPSGTTQVDITAGSAASAYALYCFSADGTRTKMTANRTVPALGGIVIQSGTTQLSASGLLNTSIVGGCRVYCFAPGGWIG